MTVAITVDRDEDSRHAIRPGTVRRVLSYIRPHTAAITGLLAIIVADASLAVVPPLLFKSIVDNGVLRENLRIVVSLSLLALLVALASTGAQIVMQWMNARLGQGLVFRLRNDAYEHVQNLPISFFTHQSSGALISRVNNDTLGAQAAISGVLPQVVSSVTRMAFVVGTIAYLSWPVMLMLLAIPVIVILPARWVARHMHRISHARMRSVADLTAFVTERLNVSGALLVQLYGNRQREQCMFSEKNAHNRDLGVRMSLIGGSFSTALGGLSTVSVVMVYLAGGFLVINGPMSVGTLIALTALLPQLYGPMNSLSTTQVEIMNTLACFERVFELLDQPRMVVETADASSTVSEDKLLEFDQVWFTYPAQPTLDNAAGTGEDTSAGREPVLRDISFRVQPGQRVAVVGPSGAGKSTVAALIPRLYDIGDGTIRIGSQDVREVDLARLRDSIGMLTQDAHLFHDTIRNNLLYARPSADEWELVEACEAASIWSVIAELPDGLDTVVGDRGHRMSGGEKQRLAIARLLLKAPSIVLLDEATAHLDSESEAAVHQALERALVGRTTLMIAHRLSTVQSADEILVLDQGRIVERGVHEDLLAVGGLYTQLWRGQLESDGRARVPR